MAKSTSSNYKTKKEAQNALDRFKMEVASEIGVNLKQYFVIIMEKDSAVIPNILHWR